MASGSTHEVIRNQVVLLMLGAAFIGFVPGGIVSQGVKRADIVGARNEAAMALSPLHQICALCDKPATHSQEYRRHGTGMPAQGEPVTYYFCDDHWPPPSSDPLARLSHKSGRLPPNAAFGLFAVLVGGGYGYMLFLVSSAYKGTRTKFRDLNRSATVAKITFGCSVAIWLILAFLSNAL